MGVSVGISVGIFDRLSMVASDSVLPVVLMFVSVVVLMSASVGVLVGVWKGVLGDLSVGVTGRVTGVRTVGVRVDMLMGVSVGV